MSGRDCATVRRRLSSQADAADAATAGHLGGCAACRTFAEGLDAVLHHLTNLPGPVPPSLRGEVLEDLGAPASASASRRVGRVLHASRRTVLSLLAALGGAVAGVLLVLLLAGPGSQDGDAATRLAEVAAHHAGTGTSHRFDLAGDLELRLPPGPRTPRRTELEERLGRLGAAADLDAGAILGVSFRGQGETDGRGVLTYELRWRLDGPVRAGGVLDVTSVDGRTLLRRDTGPWVEVTGGAGFDLGVVALPHHLAEVLAELAGAEESAAMARVDLGGEPVDHLRARTPSGMVVDVWVGAADDWLRRLRWIPAPPIGEGHGTTHGEVVLRFREHGRARVLGVPDEVAGIGEVDRDRRPPLLPESESARGDGSASTHDAAQRRERQH